MSRLLGIYPRAWRERYRAELTALLADRPPTVVDRFDIVLGAVDAWIHPQVTARSSDQPDDPPRSRDRLRAIAGVVSGSLFTIAGIGMNASPIVPSLGYKSVDAFGLLLVGGMALSALIALRELPGRTAAAGGWAAALLIAAVLTAMPWPVLIIGFLGYGVVTLVYGLVLAASGRQPLGVLLAIAALLLMSANTEDERALLTIPIGLAWIAVGALGVRRTPVPVAA
jgi:hypothetical protein